MSVKRKIQVRRGAAADRPTLSSGEFGLDTDTGSEALYIGTPAGNKSISQLALPSQTGNSGKFLTTNGTVASWGTASSVTYVDVPLPFILQNNQGSGTTFYYPLTGTVAGSTTEDNVPHVPFGIAGTIVGMYVQLGTNSSNGTTTVTLQYGAADASSFSSSDVAAVLTTTVQSGSDTAHTLAVTPTMVGGFKIAITGGTGSITLITITLVVRCTLA